MSNKKTKPINGKSLLKHIKSFIRDSLDIVIKCPRDLDEVIVMLDVINLYTRIPHEFGIAILRIGRGKGARFKMSPPPTTVPIVSL